MNTSALRGQWPSYSEDEKTAVMEVLASGKTNYWTGDQCRKFESEFADFCGVKNAVALSNGTVALELALKALEISFGDEVIVPSRSFVASAMAILNCGATPIFADVSLETQNISLESIKTLISNKTKAVICVHLAGWPCDMDPILDYITPRGISLIEDCAQAHGAVYKGRPVGSVGRVGCWSFCQDKIISTGGEGGMVTTNDSSLYEKIWSLKDHGKSREKMSVPGDGAFRFVHDSIGTNCRMTEIQAAIGRVQLKKMPAWTERRNVIRSLISDAANSCDGIWAPSVFPMNYICSKCVTEQMTCTCVHASYATYIFVQDGMVARDSFRRQMREMGVPCIDGSCSEIYKEKAFLNTAGIACPNSVTLGAQSLRLPCHPTLTDDDVQVICQALYRSALSL